MSSAWIDLSALAFSGMAHWPDTPLVQIERMLDGENRDGCRRSLEALNGAQSGTHMGALCTPMRHAEKGWVI